MKIVVLEADAVGRDVSYEPLKEFGELILYDSTPDDMIADRIKDADIVIPNKCLLTKDVLKCAPDIKLICEAATGYNNIDIDYCKEQGIPVTNVSGYSTDNVAQHTFALLLHLVEKLDYYATYVEDGDYSLGASFTNVSRPYHELNGMTYGVCGMGKIGRRVADIASSFGMNVIYYSASGNTYDVPFRAVTFDELLMESDVVGIHCPLTEATDGLFDFDAFRRMKKTAILINVARGRIVVQDDLYRALEEGEIQAAGLDVYESEPLPKDSKLFNVLNRDRLIMTPHTAWGSVEARTRLIEEIRLNIKAFLAGENRSRIV